MLRAGGLAAAIVLCLLALVAQAPAAEPEFGTATISGGSETSAMVLSGVRFGSHDDFNRIVIEFSQRTANGTLEAANGIPVYEVEYREHPYRLVMRFPGAGFSPAASIQSKDALPFTVVTSEDNTIKELQLYLSGPSRYKVIEVGWDDIGAPRLAIDVQRTGAEVPRIFTVQLLGPTSATEGFALVEGGEFPADFNPDVLVLADVVVVEQVFSGPAEAAAMNEALQAMGYRSVINERRGDELPQA